MQIKHSKKGFTLLELLVVVAVIGLFAAIVLTITNGGRVKGADAAIKSNLTTVRSQSEIFSFNNNNIFLPSGGSTFSIAACPAYNAAGTNMLSRDAIIAGAIAEATNRGGNGNRCYNSSTRWAVAVGLKSSASISWCVDSSGTSKSVASAPGAAINGSTFVCN